MNKQPKIYNKLLTVISIVIIAAGIGLAASLFFDFLLTSGQNLPLEESHTLESLVTDYIIAIGWAFFLGMCILICPMQPGNKRALLLVWMVKIIVVLGFMLLYEARYPSDYSGYLGPEAHRDFKWEWYEIGNQGYARQIVSIISWLQFFVLPYSFHATKVSFAMVGLIAVYIFYRTAVVFLQREDRRIFYALALFPSILFWSSFLGKEPVILIFIAIYVYGAVGWYRFKQLRYFLILLLAIIISVLIRVWMGPIMLIPFILLLYQRINKTFPKIIYIGCSVLLLLYSYDGLLKRFQAETTQELILVSTDKTARGFATTEGGSARELNVELTSISSIAAFAPKGAFTALFRPLPGEVRNPFGLLAGIENLLLLVLLLRAIKRARWQELKEPLTIWAILFVLLWAISYGFVSSFNLGTSVRYRLQILPVLLGLLLYLGRRRPKQILAKRRYINPLGYKG